MENNAAQNLYELLVTKDFEPEATKNGKPPLNIEGQEDVSEANMFKFNFKTSNKDYGTVVILLGAKNNMIVYYGDNVGRTMQGDDKQDWYRFLEHLKNFAARNFLDFQLDNINRLKYNIQGMAAIKEGLFEGFYGRKNLSYSDQPKKVKLMIKHTRDIREGESRHRAIEKIFVETADGERFLVPSRSLMHGKMLARHCAEGGKPYDAFGNHINEIMHEMATLSRFIRASKNRPLRGDAADLAESAIRHYGDLKAKAKQMISQRGYHRARESFDPAAINDTNTMVETIRNLFIEQTLDSRIEEALPILAKLKERDMHEVTEFESWANTMSEGTWSVPETKVEQKRLSELMANPLPVGPDATNATEQLYDLIGDDELFDQLSELAATDPDADARPIIRQRLAQLGIDLEFDDADTDTGDNKTQSEDLDTDGVMMTRSSNMSSESIDYLKHIRKLALI